MDKPISVGDLVQVVRPRLRACKCADGQAGLTLGRVFVVSAIRDNGTKCADCNVDLGTHRLAYGAGEGVYELERLKRIPPLSELETARTEETLKVPA